MHILVTGGAGFIGSFMVKCLLDDGYGVVVVDSLERGHKHVVDQRASFVQGDLRDKNFVNKLFDQNKFDGVMHFAAYIAVGESVEKPGEYFVNNVFSTIALLDAMEKHDVKHFIFSSTGTVYGTPMELPIPEIHAKNPENPYAESKLMVEKVLHWYHQSYGINFSVLRYFNAAGAAFDGSMGEDHIPETHLIPNAIKAAINNTTFSLFGDDYATSDGTTVRDYIHVLDLIEAHMLTFAKMQKEKTASIYNVGTGTGHTNKEVLEMVKLISGKNFPVEIKPRREGDVASTVADVNKIRQELGFMPKYSSLQTIIETAWKWHTKNS